MRVVVICMSPRLVMTHKFVKCLSYPVELRVGEARMEREGEGPLEGRVRPRERARAAVGAEAVEGVGADLALDALRAERPHHAIAVVELDHVGLPAVAVAGVRLREDDVEMREPLRVAGGDS